MAFATTSDGVRLFYESAGQGAPLVFVHEFGGNHWSWEPQVGYFSRRHQCITFAARGYPPSDVPESVEQYSQARAADDIVDVMNAAGVEKAHIVGLSMGGFACLHSGSDGGCFCRSAGCRAQRNSAARDVRQAFGRDPLCFELDATGPGRCSHA